LHDCGVTVFEREHDPYRILRPPRLRSLDGGERHASYLELFFDLVFVVAVAQLAHELVLDHSLGGFGTFAGLYLPVFIAWQGFSVYADRFDTDDLVFRIVIFCGMLAILALAVEVPDVAHGESAGFAIAYVVLRSLMLLLYARSWVHVPEARPLISRYAAGYGVGVAVWVVSLAFPSPARYVLWGVALAWEYSLPTIVRRLHGAIPVTTSHLPERFALFTIIVLGESVVAVALGTADSEWRPTSAAIAVLGFFLAAGIWWTYFGGGAELQLRRSTTPILIFTHAHIPLLAALTAVGAGISLAIEQAGAGELDTGTRWALAGGVAAYLVCVTIAQRATVVAFPPQTAQSRAVAVAALVVLAVFGEPLDPLVFTAVTTGTVVVLVAFKIWSAQYARVPTGRAPASPAAPEP
jgi:low temperature requirement protein LtrA